MPSWLKFSSLFLFYQLKQWLKWSHISLKCQPNPGPLVCISDIISSLFDFPLQACCLWHTACLTLGGHIIPLVSRPVWYADFWSPVLSFYSEPWDFSAPHKHAAMCFESLLHKVSWQSSYSLHSLSGEKRSCCGKLHNLLSVTKRWFMLEEVIRSVILHLVFTQVGLRWRSSLSAVRVPVLWHVRIGMNVNTSGMGVLISCFSIRYSVLQESTVF